MNLDEKLLDLAISSILAGCEGFQEAEPKEHLFGPTQDVRQASAVLTLPEPPIGGPPRCAVHPTERNEFPVVWPEA